MNTYKTQVVAILILWLMGVVTVIGVITLRVLDKKEPPVTRGTNVPTAIYGTGFTYTNAYEVPSKSRVQADTNGPPVTVEPSGSISTGWSNLLFGTHNTNMWFSRWKFSTNYLSAEDPNEVTVTFHSKDGSVWTPTWKRHIGSGTARLPSMVFTNKQVWYVAISGLPKVIKLRAKSRLDAALSTGLITVWSEEEWNSTPILEGIEFDDRTK